MRYFMCPGCCDKKNAAEIMDCFEGHAGTNIGKRRCPFCGKVFMRYPYGVDKCERHLLRCQAYAASLLHPGAAYVKRMPGFKCPVCGYESCAINIMMCIEEHANFVYPTDECPFCGDVIASVPQESHENMYTVHLMSCVGYVASLLNPNSAAIMQEVVDE